MNRQRIVSEIKESLVNAIRLTGQYAFTISQQKVPVITGHLKNSGNVGAVENGTEVMYSAPYSSYVERGTRPGTRYVNSYMRRNGSHVKAFSYYSRGQRAQHYIENPLKQAFIEEKSFANHFDGQLRSKGFKVIRG